MSLKNEIVTSESGRRMMGYVLPIYDFDRFMLILFQLAGVEVDDLQEWTRELREQAFPQTATWGLRYFEQMLGLPVNESLPIEERRRRILTKMTTEWPVTRTRMEYIINGYVPSQTAKVVEYFSEYSFAAILPIDEPINYIEMGKAVYDAKPAHLRFIVSPQAKETITITDSIKTTMRRYHKVYELRVGMPLMKYEQEVVL